MLNYFGKVVEKLVAEQLSKFCKVKRKLHKSQMRGKNERLTIDATSLMIQKVPEIWENQYIITVFLMDVKRAFDYNFWAKFMQKMADLNINDDLIGWMQLFLINR